MEEPRFKILDRIVVIDGEFKGLAGTIVRIGYTPGHLTTKIDVPGGRGPATVELRVTQVELYSPRPPA